MRTRLRHLGFRPGTKVVKLRTAPLGDPAVYRLLGYDTCLRRHEAAYLEVSEEVSEEVAAAVPEEIGEQP